MTSQFLDNAQKERHTKYFDSQKTLFNSKKFSDFTIVCGDRSWPAHKAILCTQSEWFAKAMHDVDMKEKEEGKVTLPDEDPEIVDLALRFMYEQDYDVPQKTAQPYSTPGLQITWGKSDGFSRNIRGRVQYDITHVNHTAMAEAVTLVQGTQFQQTLNSMNKICLTAGHITEELALQLIEIFEKKDSTVGPAWYIDDYDGGELIHAKLYRMGDFYHIAGLCELALHRVGSHLTTTFDEKVNREVVHYLMDNTSREDTRVRMDIANLLSADLNRFGVRSHAKDWLDQYPVLKDYLLYGIFHDDVSKGFCWDPIAQSIESPSA